MSESKKFIIGTRGSLLATTQCELIKEEMERLTGAQFELKIIKTQGDQIQDKALWQLEGKDFFTKELDEALLNKEVDLVVHSYKDLGSIRPQGIMLAAVTERKYAHDILLIKKDKIKDLPKLKKLTVGTSSPRRITNITNHLKKFLPNIQEELEITTEILRGNVNTRLKKLIDNQYDAIVLAMAGLERLCHKENSLKEISPLLNELDFMIMPMTYFPSAASQGALAIECHEFADEKLKKIIQSVHHPDTFECVKYERDYFKSYGGGCHLAIGIHTGKTLAGHVHFHLGVHDNKTISKKWLTTNKKKNKTQAKKIFIGSKGANTNQIIFDEVTFPLAHSFQLPDDGIFFVTSKHCLTSYAPQSTFCAGIETHKELVKRGIWVNGSLDSLGYKILQNWQNSKLLKQFFNNKKWYTLTQDDGQSEIGEVIGCYARNYLPLSPAFQEQLSSVEAFYWTSYAQYRHYLKEYPVLADKKYFHSCGIGKTLEEFMKHGVEINPFLNPQEFQESLLIS
jgi:hydroxymethylbilane synthase